MFMEYCYGSWLIASDDYLCCGIYRLLDEGIIDLLVFFDLWTVTTSESRKENTIVLNIALITGIPMVAIVVAAGMVIFCLKKYSGEI